MSNSAGTSSDANPLNLSVSIVTYHCDMELVAGTLASLQQSVALAQQRSALNYHLYIVSNDENRYWIEQVKALADSAQCSPEARFVKLMEGHGNIGFARGHNLAIEAAESDMHLILNPDVLLEPECISESVEFLTSNSRAVMTVPQGFDSDGHYACLAKRQPSLLVLAVRALTIQPRSAWLRAKMAHYVYADALPSASAFRVEHASGCYMCCRTQALKAIGGFDSGYFLYFEDYDLSRRIAKFGAIYELPHLRIRHYGGRTAQRGWLRIWRFLTSGFRFFNRYGWRIS